MGTGKKKEHGDLRPPLLWRIVNAEERPAITRRIDWAILAVACLLAVWFDIVLYEHSGAFWRDEADTLHIAARPDVGTMWAWLSKDSAPVLCYAAVRLWTAVGLGGSDEGLRAFGIFVSLGIIVSLFFTCRALTGRVPLLAMALIVFNSAVFYYGSSLRAYGMAALFIMPCLAAFWRVVQGPTKWNILASLLLGLLSCHASYQNSYLLFAIGIAGAGACAVCRLWRRSALVLAICLAVALSLLVYIPTISSYREGSQIQAHVFSLATIGRRLADVISCGDVAWLRAWGLLALASLASLSIQAIRCSKAAPTGNVPSLAFYLLIAAVLAVTVSVAFIRIHGIVPNPWHTIPLVAFLGVVMEVAFQSRRNKAWVWCIRVGAALIVIALSVPGMWSNSLLRRTNLDCVCTVLAENASPQDLILVSPFWMAPGFKYYYRGHAEWNTIPLTSSELDVSTNPFFAAKRLMMTPHAIGPTLRKIESTLASGHRVWIVGFMEDLPQNGVPPDPPVAPLSPTGWNCDVYTRAWALQALRCIRTNARTERVLLVTMSQPVSGLENVPLMLAEGWKER